MGGQAVLGRVRPEVPTVPALTLVSSPVARCVDLVTGLVSAEGVGEIGLSGNNVVLGGGPCREFFCRSSLRDHDRGHRPGASGTCCSRSAGCTTTRARPQQLPRRWPRRAGNPGHHLCCRSDSFTPLRGLCRAELGGCRRVATRWECSATGGYPWPPRWSSGRLQRAAHPGTIIGHTPRRPDPCCPLIHCNE
jgi:hypothetical protein